MGFSYNQVEKSSGLEQPVYYAHLKTKGISSKQDIQEFIECSALNGPSSRQLNINVAVTIKKIIKFTN